MGKEGQEVMTSNEVAQLLGISAGRVRQLAREGRLAGSRRGRDWIFIAEDVRRFAADPRPSGRPREG